MVIQAIGDEGGYGGGKGIIREGPQLEGGRKIEGGKGKKLDQY